MMLYEAEYAPEHLIVKGAIVKQPKGRYMMGIKFYELPIDLPSGRIIAVTYKKFREIGGDGDIIYDPYDVNEALIDFGYLGKFVVRPSSLVIADRKLVCITNAV